MPESPWKRTERMVAKWLGGKRVPVSGRQEAGVDIDNPWLAIEVKHRKKLPEWMRKAMAQAVAAAAMPRHWHKLPVVVLHDEGEPHGDNWVCMRMADFVGWFGDAQEDNTP